MPGFFEYKAIFWDETTEETELGVTYASSYAEAMKNIEDYYGETIVKITLYGCETNPVYVLDGPTRVEFFQDN